MGGWGSRRALRGLLGGILLGPGLLSTGACERRPETIAVGRILIDAPPKFDGAAEDRDTLRRGIRAALENAPSVDLPENGRGTHILRVRLTDPTGTEALTPSVVVELTPTGSALNFVAVAEATVGSGLAGMVGPSFRLAWARIDAMRQLEVGDEDDLLRGSRDRDPQIQKYAIRLLGQRKVTEAVDPLCALIQDKDADPGAVLAAVGALASIGDERAVKPMTELTFRREPAFVLQIVFAVAAIGGRSADGFLVTLASGHPNPAVQKGAQDALEEMRRREAAPAPGSP